jgi:hypothetical protein
MQSADQESGDLMDNANGVVTAGVGLFVFIVVCVGAAWLMKWALGPDIGPAGVDGVVQPGGVPLPSDELTLGRLAAEASWAAQSRAWEWVDPVAGVARIPVERAAEIALERGFPVRREPGQPIAMRGAP